MPAPPPNVFQKWQYASTGTEGLSEKWQYASTGTEGPL
jgi:hypothetical protein